MLKNRLSVKGDPEAAEVSEKRSEGMNNLAIFSGLPHFPVSAR